MNGKAQTPRHPADTGPGTVAVVGAGHWGKNLVRNFAELGALRAVVDRDLSVAETLANKHNVPVRSFTEVLHDEISGIAIAAPAELHYDLAHEALMAGKHVFVEKPLALRVEDASTLCELAAARGLILMVGHLLQYHPAFQKLQDLSRAGELGRLQYLYSNRLNLGKFRREENILWSFAPHDISMILALVGEMPDMVSAAGSSYLHKSIADVTLTHLRFPGGENAHVYVSWLHPVKEQKLVVVGDKAMAIFDDTQDWQSKLTLYKHEVKWKDGLPTPERADGTPVELDPAEPLRVECKHFIDCLHDGMAPRTDGAEGLRVLQVLETAERAMRTATALPLAGEAASVSSRPGVTIHETACIDHDVTIGEGTNVWHFSHVLSGSRIGRNCTLGQNVCVGPDVTIGDNCKIQNSVSVYKGVTLEDGVFCGPAMVFTNVVNPRAEVDRRSEFQETIVKRGATIGANATILCGTNLGEYCFVGAGALVTRDVPAFALMVGAPARRVGWVSHHGERLGEDLVCPVTGRRYREAGPDHLEEIMDE